jgi:hypothetical protein
MEQQEANNPVPASQNVATAMAPPLCMLAPMEAYGPLHLMTGWWQQLRHGKWHDDPFAVGSRRTLEVTLTYVACATRLLEPLSI